MQKCKKVNSAVICLKYQAQFVLFFYFLLSIMRHSKFNGRILDSFECQQFWTYNAKAMAKGKNVSIAITYFKYQA
jgi:hypothetical protein